MTDKEEYPNKCESLSGTNYAYSVQAKYNYSEPRQFGDTIYHKEWKTVKFTESINCGVPNNSECWVAEHFGLFSYAAAQALRWWFHANTEQESYMARLLETRIVKHKIEYSFKQEAIPDNDYISEELKND